MPAVNEKQREAMTIAEHHPEKLYARNKGMKSMSHKQLHEFASSVKKSVDLTKLSTADLSYLEGFVKTCVDKGLDPEAVLLKRSDHETEKIVGGTAAGAAAGVAGRHYAPAIAAGAKAFGHKATEIGKQVGEKAHAAGTAVAGHAKNLGAKAVEAGKKIVPHLKHAEVDPDFLEGFVKRCLDKGVDPEAVARKMAAEEEKKDDKHSVKHVAGATGRGAVAGGAIGAGLGAGAAGLGVHAAMKHVPGASLKDPATRQAAIKAMLRGAAGGGIAGGVTGALVGGASRAAM